MAQSTIKLPPEQFVRLPEVYQEIILTDREISTEMARVVPRLNRLRNLKSDKRSYIQQIEGNKRKRK